LSSPKVASAVHTIDGGVGAPKVESEAGVATPWMKRHAL